MAPEVLLLDPTAIEGKRDIYAAGLVLLELCCGSLPLQLRAKQIEDPRLRSMLELPGHPLRTMVVSKVRSNLQRGVPRQCYLAVGTSEHIRLWLEAISH